MVNVHQYAVKYTKILLLLFAFFGLTIALSDELDDDFPGRVITSFIIIFNWLFLCLYGQESGERQVSVLEESGNGM